MAPPGSSPLFIIIKSAFFNKEIRVPEQGIRILPLKPDLGSTRALSAHGNDVSDPRDGRLRLHHLLKDVQLGNQRVCKIHRIYNSSFLMHNSSVLIQNSSFSIQNSSF